MAPRSRVIAVVKANGYGHGMIRVARSADLPTLRDVEWAAGAMFHELGMTAVANDEPFFGMSDYFFPMWRVERITRDERSGEIPSMAEQFEQKTGLKIWEF